jgi:hypothetical protein
MSSDDFESGTPKAATIPSRNLAHSKRLTEKTPSVEPALSAHVVAPARYVLLPLANAMTGYSVKAMQRKIESGDWPEGKVWKRAPDGRVLIDVQGYYRWAEGP